MCWDYRRTFPHLPLHGCWEILNSVFTLTRQVISYLSKCLPVEKNEERGCGCFFIWLPMETAGEDTERICLDAMDICVNSWHRSESSLACSLPGSPGLHAVPLTNYRKVIKSQVCTGRHNVTHRKALASYLHLL